MAYGIQTYSGTTGDILFDSNEPYQGVCTVERGTVNFVTTTNPAESAAGIVYAVGDLILVKPSVTVANNTGFLLTGKIFQWTSSPLRFKIQFYSPDGGSSYTSVDYVVIRAMSSGTPSGNYGLQCYEHNGSYLTKTFDSRLFIPNQVKITNVSTSRPSHTSTYGSINNGEWYHPGMVSMATGTYVEKYVGIHFGNNVSMNYNGPSPNTFSGSGISHYGQSLFSSTYGRYEGDYPIRGEDF